MDARNLRHWLFTAPGDDDSGKKARDVLTVLASTAWSIPLHELEPGGPWEPGRTAMQAYLHAVVNASLWDQPLFPGCLEFADVVAGLARVQDASRELSVGLVQVVHAHAASFEQWRMTSERLFRPCGQAPAIVPSIAEALQSSGGYTRAWAQQLRAAFSSGRGCSEQAQSMLEATLAHCEMSQRLLGQPMGEPITQDNPERRPRVRL